VIDVPSNPKFKDLSSVVELCHRLVEIGKSEEYYLINRLCSILTLVVYDIFFHYFNMQVLTVFLSRLIRLVLTLLVSTTTTDRALSAMKLVKTRLRNKMRDNFLRDCLVIYIEKEIAIKFTTDALIYDFYEMETRRVQLK
jgi:hypothetical protein